MSRHIYTIFDQLCSGEQTAIGELAFEQDDKVGITHCQFRYLIEYLQRDTAKPIDPVNLPLSNDLFEFTALPGALNDVLPDRWGRQVALRLSNITCNDIAGLIDWLSEHHIGSLNFAQRGMQPSKRSIGPPEDVLRALDIETKKFEQSASPTISDQWAFTVASGASVGGARRKTLVSSQRMGYLVKFSQKTDPINMPRVEHAVMSLAKQAGVDAADTHVERVNGRDALFVRRFDIVDGWPCRQVLSFESLLNGQANHYGELAQVVIQHVSTSTLEATLVQLYRQMCFNICINNTDDHLRNFSLIRDENGWHHSPAYDLVPSTSLGEYHQLGFDYSVTPPQGKALVRFAEQFFHLRTEQAVDAIQRCESAVKQWKQHFCNEGVDAADIRYLESIIMARLT
jgi:serine/threonine-protein kinase HipA